MQRQQSWSRLNWAAMTLVVTLVLVSGAWSASTERVIYSFRGGTDGSDPQAGLIFDAVGNLYGTTAFGGPGGCSGGCGTVFKLKPTSDAGWKESVLYSFTGGTDGLRSFASLILDKAGARLGELLCGRRFE